MKEFSALTGGRYTYADDLENIQELALAFAQIFDDCDNFIISGCEVSGSTISSGYVYMNGKLRHFSGASDIGSWPQYIYEVNSSESVPYESGGQKVGRKNYGCAVAQSVPVALDPITGKSPAFIAMPETGGLRMKDAFFGKYALVLNPSGGSQTVKGNVNFAQKIQANGTLTAMQSIVMKSGTMDIEMSSDSDTFTIQSINSSNKQYKLMIVGDVGFMFYVDGELVATLSDSIVFRKPLSASQASIGGLVLSGSQFYQGTSNQTADLYINFLGYNGGSTQYRNTYIGNGKSRVLISVNGANSSIGLDGATTITVKQIDGLVLKSDKLKSNSELVNAIAWKDFNNETLAHVGFISTVDQKFYIACPSSNIHIVGSSVVNIAPAISENGVLLSEKYALQSATSTALNAKANAEDVYSKLEADSAFASKAGGLSQFVGPTSAASCRSAIGAMGANDLKSYAKLSDFLADMATTEAAKQTIRTNIGAAAVGSFQPVLSDTGWILLKDSLYVRQIGNIVSIQGKITTVHSGTVFTIPYNVQAPTHAVKHTIAFSNNRNWICKINAEEKACQVVYCDSSCNQTTEFSITYMV